MISFSSKSTVSISALTNCFFIAVNSVANYAPNMLSA
jgi:hypothetical protein